MGEEVRLSATVMGTPKRRMLATRIGEMVGAGLVIDEEMIGMWPTARRAWGSYDPEASHHLVLEEDVWPCQNLLEGAATAVAAASGARGDCVVTLFNHRVMVRQAIERGSAWAVHPWTTGQAVVMPTHLIQGFFEWCEREVHQMVDSADGRVSLWAWSQGLEVMHTCPSLVEHLGANQTVVESENRGANWSAGYAARFIGENEDAGEVDWTRGVKDPPVFDRGRDFPQRLEEVSARKELAMDSRARVKTRGQLVNNIRVLGEGR